MVLVLALVLAAKHERSVITFAFDLRRHVDALRLQLAIEGTEALNGRKLGSKSLRQRKARFGAEKQDPLPFAGRVDGAGGKGMEKSLQGIAAHGRGLVIVSLVGPAGGFLSVCLPPHPSPLPLGRGEGTTEQDSIPDLRAGDHGAPSNPLSPQCGERARVRAGHRTSEKPRSPASSI